MKGMRLSVCISCLQDIVKTDPLQKAIVICKRNIANRTFFGKIEVIIQEAVFVVSGGEL